MNIAQRIRLDRICGKKVRDRGKCDKCRSIDNLTWAHIISRRYYSTRWDLDNALCLCLDCHRYYTDHPFEWEIWVRNKIGGRYDNLYLKANTYMKMDYKEVLKKLK